MRALILLLCLVGCRNMSAVPVEWKVTGKHSDHWQKTEAQGAKANDLQSRQLALLEQIADDVATMTPDEAAVDEPAAEPEPTETETGESTDEKQIWTAEYFGVVLLTADWCSYCQLWKSNEQPKLERTGCRVFPWDVDKRPVGRTNLPAFQLWRWDGGKWVFCKRWTGNATADEIGLEITRICDALNGSPSQAKVEAQTASIPGQVGNVYADPVAASVKIYSGLDNGSGTAIARHGNTTTVLTCEHIFRAGGEVAIQVGKRLYPATLKRRDAQADLAIVETSAPIPVAAMADAPQLGKAYALGFVELATKLTRVDGQIDRVKGYTGASAIDFSGTPQPGMSGGGLFNASGQLVGVCFGRRNDNQRGMFTSVTEARKLIQGATTTQAVSQRPERYIDWPNWGVIDLENYNPDCSNPETCAMCPLVYAKIDEYNDALAMFNATQGATPDSVIDDMLTLIDTVETLDDTKTLADLGSGDGRVLITATQRYGCKGIGIEIDPVKADEARQAVKDAGLSHRIKIITGDVLDFNAGRYDVSAVTAHLYPDLLEQLAGTFRQVGVAVSPFHAIPGVETTQHGDVFLYRG